jgi:hypothetical protein
LLDNSDKEIDNTIPNKVKIEQTPIYWVNTPKIDSTLWVNN